MMESKTDARGAVVNEEDMDSGYTWINWFCDLEGHEFFCEVDEEFIADNFNLYGLRPHIPKYGYPTRMIIIT